MANTLLLLSGCCCWVAVAAVCRAACLLWSAAQGHFLHKTGPLLHGSALLTILAKLPKGRPAMLARNRSKHPTAGAISAGNHAVCRDCGADTGERPLALLAVPLYLLQQRLLLPLLLLLG